MTDAHGPAAATDAAPPRKKNGLLSFALDFGPLLLFFLSYRLFDPGDNPVSAAVYSTGVFMLAIVVALILSWVLLGKISPMLWLSAILVIGFGGLTIYFGDPAFIQHKPTGIYALFAITIFIGLLRGKPAIRYLLEYAFEGLSHEGWMKLSRNWALFFLFLAIANEAIIALFDFDTWLTLKVWGVTALTLIFAVANVPMLMRHGLKVDDEEEAVEVPPQG
ncbi:septation protein IspZ [Novosphingopyxis sp. YJ-S2-01]|uniref:septation protein IspZ n=1 Tax=Novosphingopyxis sp. YJ-S2-01 TaxID=2794021 RepID=UPI0018DCACC2|nr:septation protein IspZ [Novosphingopyxis sp. YJ-S2-01]